MKGGLGDVFELVGSFYSIIGGATECLRGTWVYGATFGKITGRGWSLAGKESSYSLIAISSSTSFSSAAGSFNRLNFSFGFKVNCLSYLLGEFLTLL